MEIKDSGTRRAFESGAVRDMAEGKGDMVSIPWESILRLSRHYEAGAKKYARWNFRKGIPVSSFIDSACRHLAKYQCGEDDEDHLSAAAFNILGAMLMENTMPEMQDLPLRDGKKCFGYFEEKSIVQNDEKKTGCPDRHYHSDLDLHYCDKTYEICESPNDCPYKESE